MSRKSRPTLRAKLAIASEQLAESESARKVLENIITELKAELAAHGRFSDRANNVLERHRTIRSELYIAKQQAIALAERVVTAADMMGQHL